MNNLLLALGLDLGAWIWRQEVYGTLNRIQRLWMSHHWLDVVFNLLILLPAQIAFVWGCWYVMPKGDTAHEVRSDCRFNQEG